MGQTTPANVDPNEETFIEGLTNAFMLQSKVDGVYEMDLNNILPLGIGFAAGMIISKFKN